MAGNNQNLKTKRNITFIIIVAVVIVGCIVINNRPKCIADGCDLDAMEDSYYCYDHEPVAKPSKSTTKKTYGSASKSVDNNREKSDSVTNNATSAKPYSNKNSSKKSTYQDTYDEGCDDIYMDGDYDYDRYSSDDDYARGVDDAMDDEDCDW